jgi:hypothetical protein
VGLATAGVLGLGAALRRVAGDAAAALGMILVSLSPSLIAFEHHVLTEAGSFCLVALILAALVWPVKIPRCRWVQVLTLVLLLTAGYYFRQNILLLAPVVAVLYLARMWPQASAIAGKARARLIAIGQAIVILAVPYLASIPWQRYGDDAELAKVMFSQTLFLQKLIPFDHPALGKHADYYRQAVELSKFQGGFYSGMRRDLYYEIVARTAPAMAGKYRQIFWECLRSHPERYRDAIGRTVAVFFGMPGALSECQRSCDSVMSPVVIASSKTNSVCEGPAELFAANRRDFRQAADASALMCFVWRTIPLYAYILPATMFLSLVGLLVGLLRRHWLLFCLAALPWAALAPYVLALLSVDRYAVPAQSVLFAVAPSLIVLVWRACRPAKPAAKP